MHIYESLDLYFSLLFRYKLFNKADGIIIQFLKHFYKYNIFCSHSNSTNADDIIIVVKNIFIFNSFILYLLISKFILKTRNQ